ncbi:hypothetical protein Bca52824_092022 [Brassica carinata]|uniref:Uncharacterized protein n=1 Tax=Brassica carinata TaxID=52824 RepID=A0A8X7NSE1_BRACI|nr:hypothetical protein Bca52824_092022 [Brassica carinata]
MSGIFRISGDDEFFTGGGSSMHLSPGSCPGVASQHARDYALPLLLRRRFTVPSRRSKLRSKCCLTSVCSRSSGACLLQGERGASVGVGLRVKSHAGLELLLEAVPLLRCPGITDKGLVAITRISCPRIGDQGVSFLLAQAGSYLTKVKLQMVNVTGLSLAVLGHSRIGVTDLVLHGLQVGNGCPDLKHVCLNKCLLVSGKGLAALAKSASSLESLKLEECHRVNQFGFLGFLMNCGSTMKSFSMANCLGISEAPLPSSTSCSLASLSIRHCPGFGDASLSFLGKLCHQLQDIELCGLNGVTDAALRVGSEQQCRSSEGSFVGGCSAITDKSKACIQKLGPTLLGLNIQRCGRISSSTVDNLLEHLWRYVVVPFIFPRVELLAMTV